MDEAPVGLAEAIGQVRSELITAQRQGQTEDLRFRLGEVELQFEVAFSKEGGGEAGVKLWVVNVGAKGSVTASRTHTVTVTMTPQQLSEDGTFEDVMVGDEIEGRPPLHDASANQ